MRILKLLPFLTLLLCSTAQAETVLLKLDLDSTKVFEDVSEPDGTVFKVAHIIMKPESAQAYADFTGKNVGKCVYFRLNDKLFDSPVVRSQMTGGLFIFSEEFHNMTLEGFISTLEDNGKLTVSDEE